MSKFNFTWWEKQLESADSKKKSALRYYNFSTIVYPESAPSDWIQRLDDYQVAYFISPLHDRDVNMLGTEPKKPHYHVIVMYESKKSYTQIKELFDDIGGVGGEIVQSLRGASRYLCHLDNPDKKRYSTSEVRQGFGADYDKTITLVSDIRTATAMMTQVIDNENILHFDDFVIYCRDNNMEWFNLLSEKRTFFIKEYINSRWKKYKNCSFSETAMALQNLGNKKD